MRVAWKRTDRLHDRLGRRSRNDPSKGTGAAGGAGLTNYHCAITGDGCCDRETGWLELAHALKSPCLSPANGFATFAADEIVWIRKICIANDHRAGTAYTKRTRVRAAVSRRAEVDHTA